MKHKHHIIPKHMGGSDDPDNLIALTRAQHAEAHRALYEQYGKQEDLWAWKFLSKSNDWEWLQGDRNPSKRPEVREKISATMLEYHRTHPASDELRQRKREVKLGELNPQYGKHVWNAGPHPKATCVHCGKEATLGNIVRWHNDNCKYKKS